MATRRTGSVLAGAATLMMMLSGFGSPSTASATAGSETELTFVVTNDFHGRIDANTVRWAGTIEELRADAEPSMFLSVGDNFGNSLYASSVQGEKPTVDVLNALELEASAVGNGDLFIGYDNFKKLASERMQSPYLAANIVDATTGAPLFEPYIIRELGGVRVGIIGVVTPDTQVQFPGGNPKFLPLVPALNEAAAEIEDQNLADVTIALIHEGGGLNAPPATLEDEMATGGMLATIITQAAPSIDALLTAHTHNQYVYNAPVPGDPERTRPVIQGAAFGQGVGEVKLRYSRDQGKVVASSARAVALTVTPEQSLIANYPRVASVSGIVDAALEVAEQEGNRPAGQVTAPITTAFSGGAYGEGGYAGGSSGNRTLESSLGTLVANMFRDVQQDQPRPPQFGLTIPNFIRNDLMPDDQGNVSVMRVIETFTIRDSIVAADVTGAQLKALFEQQWQHTLGGEAKGYIQLALSDNISYTYDDTRPVGDRVTSITLDGHPVDAAMSYRVGLSGAILIGIVNFHEGVNLGGVTESGLLDVEGFQRYFAQQSAAGPIAPSFAKHGVKIVDVEGSALSGDPAAAGVSAQGTQLPTVQPGAVIEFEVSALDLTSLGAPQNTELTVLLNGKTQLTAPVIDGAARVRFAVPEALQGKAVEMELRADPSGTVVQRGFLVAASADGGGETGNQGGSGGGAAPSDRSPIGSDAVPLAETGSGGPFGWAALAGVAVLAGAIQLARRPTVRAKR
ncbi:bifunctional metallophosphatase/5'-nucleotidase [Leucobacter insecticola]|uniref:Bifunctional metallophosphatase/5'-nucleotidase n=1 Tax=Leucobacter insecticola TaxID=2714934 RepID=A0A6G8FH39_9MICO|nr:bifunctional UDP-sugar hydrolase/5'-nucleotidase [Leucobacter insecticola]QIM15589.1 bifunctional metallophosphatase/5'-nucleotidase [Leucobacter insecticola]